MSDLLKMLLGALGAIAGAIAILTGAGLTVSALAAALAGGAGIAAAVLPPAACLGGAAYAASRIGYKST
jgi:hypothetical protein